MNNQAPLSAVCQQCIAWRDAGTIPICDIDVRWVRNERTHEIEVKATLGIAPNERTIYEQRPSTQGTLRSKERIASYRPRQWLVQKNNQKSRS